MWFPWQRIYTQRMSFHIKKKKILHLLVPFCLTLYKTFKWFFSPLTLMMDKSPLSEPVKWGQESYLFHRVIGKIKWNQGFPAGSYSQRICLQCGRSEFDPGWVKSLSTVWETWVQSLGWEDPLEKEMETHSSIIAWTIPWMEGPGGLWSSKSQTWLSN